MNTTQPLKKGNLAIFDDMDGPRGHYAKWNKSKKDKYLWSHLFVESSKTTNRKNPKLTDTEKRLVAAGGGGVGGGG